MNLSFDNEVECVGGYLQHLVINRVLAGTGVNIKQLLEIVPVRRFDQGLMDIQGGDMKGYALLWSLFIQT